MLPARAPTCVALKVPARRIVIEGIEVIAKPIVTGVGDVALSVINPELRLAAFRNAADFVAKTREKCAPVHFLRMGFVRVENKLKIGHFPISKVAGAFHVVWIHWVGAACERILPGNDAVYIHIHLRVQKVKKGLVIGNPRFIELKKMRKTGKWNQCIGGCGRGGFCRAGFWRRGFGRRGGVGGGRGQCMGSAGKRRDSRGGAECTGRQQQH